MRDYEDETKRRIKFIGGVVKSAGADGAVYGNSGGKQHACRNLLQNGV